MNAREALARATEKLRAAGIDSARLDARVLLAHVMGIEPNEIVLNPPLEGGILSQFEELIARRIAREPIAYITGKKGFWDLEFAVGPGALVPRPETETLIEEILKEFPDRAAPLRILDLGTGTGCILITLLHLYPNARGLGVDVSAEALSWAQKSAGAVESRCAFRQANWDAIRETGFDIVVSNPPYLSQAEMGALEPELSFEPREALAGAADGLEAYRAIAALLPGLLAPKGCTVLEIGRGQGPAVSAILEAHGLEILRLASDLSGIPRCLMARMSPAAPQKMLGNLGPNG